MGDMNRVEEPGISRIYMAPQEGKTTLALQMVKGWKAQGVKAAYVAPSQDMADFHRGRAGLGMDDVLWPDRMIKDGGAYQVLVLDDCERFPVGEGDPLRLALALVALGGGFHQVVGFFTRWEKEEVGEDRPSRDAEVIASLRFPTMLRRMWSGGEVQEWLAQQAEARLRRKEVS